MVLSIVLAAIAGYLGMLYLSSAVVGFLEQRSRHDIAVSAYLRLRRLRSSAAYITGDYRENALSMKEQTEDGGDESDDEGDNDARGGGGSGAVVARSRDGLSSHASGADGDAASTGEAAGGDDDTEGAGKSRPVNLFCLPEDLLDFFRRSYADSLTDFLNERMVVRPSILKLTAGSFARGTTRDGLRRRAGKRPGNIGGTPRRHVPALLIKGREFKSLYDEYCFLHALPIVPQSKWAASMEVANLTVVKQCDSSTEVYQNLRIKSQVEFTRDVLERAHSPGGTMARLGEAAGDILGIAERVLPGETSLQAFVRIHCVTSPFTSDVISKATFHARHSAFVTRMQAAGRKLHKAPVTRRAMLNFGATLTRQTQQNVRSHILELLRDEHVMADAKLDIAASGGPGGEAAESGVSDVADIFRYIVRRPRLGQAREQGRQSRQNESAGAGMTTRQRARVVVENESLQHTLTVLLLLDFAMLIFQYIPEVIPRTPGTTGVLENIALAMVSVFALEIAARAFAMRGQFDMLETVDALVVYLSLIINLVEQASSSSGDSTDGKNGNTRNFVRLGRVARLVRVARVAIRARGTILRIKRARAARGDSLGYYIASEYVMTGRASDFVVALHFFESYRAWLSELAIDSGTPEDGAVIKDVLVSNYGVVSDTLLWREVAREEMRARLEVAKRNDLFRSLGYSFVVAALQLLAAFLIPALMIGFAVFFESQFAIYDHAAARIVSAEGRQFTSVELRTRPWRIFVSIIRDLTNAQGSGSASDRGDASAPPHLVSYAILVIAVVFSLVALICIVIYDLGEPPPTIAMRIDREDDAAREQANIEAELAEHPDDANADADADAEAEALAEEADIALTEEGPLQEEEVDTVDSSKRSLSMQQMDGDISNKNEQLTNSELMSACRNAAAALPLETIRASDAVALPAILHGAAKRLFARPPRERTSTGARVLLDAARHLSQDDGDYVVLRTWSLFGKGRCLLGRVDSVKRQHEYTDDEDDTGESSNSRNPVKASAVVPLSSFHSPSFGAARTSDSGKNVPDSSNLADTTCAIALASVRTTPFSGIVKCRVGGPSIWNIVLPSEYSARFSDVFPLGADPKIWRFARSALAQARAHDRRDVKRRWRYFTIVTASAVQWSRALFNALVFFIGSITISYVVLVVIWFFIATISNPETYLTYVLWVIYDEM